MQLESSFLINFLKELMHQRKCLPRHLASNIGVSHATLSRWLNGKDIPNSKSCKKLAEYSGLPLEYILSLVGYIPSKNSAEKDDLPGFREYVLQKYPDVFDDDLIAIFEHIIEKYNREKQNKWNDAISYTIG